MPSHIISSGHFAGDFVSSQLAAMRSATKLSPGGLLGDNDIDTDTRRSEVGWPAHGFEILRRATAAALAANDKHWGFDLGVKREYQLTHYTAADAGMYHTHMDLDLDAGGETVRKLSFVVQLSSPEKYHGGELALHHVGSPDPWLARQLGTVIVFPSVLHSVSPMLRGERWSLVAWLSGPSFR